MPKMSLANRSPPKINEESRKKTAQRVERFRRMPNQSLESVLGAYQRPKRKNDDLVSSNRRVLMYESDKWTIV